MRNIIKYFVGFIYKPLLERYLSKTRHYKYKGISLIIPPEVFHPAFFSHRNCCFATDGCDLEMINRYANEHGFRMDKVYTKQNLLEKSFIFKIQLRVIDNEINESEKHLQSV